ncbi:efflux RND transporter periplasmic adaptor subunit [Anatilimnocola floriformis]|uniref:efflux RND transporter periplasmic adaptor subunit n=1 Tax=Anatilimnocola floriformis TaxID=2948575 RepID=UPI0020C36009|nr:efflux RND transporter periplasmic adaptor subunit [Anatilimnocola floriformis]
MQPTRNFNYWTPLKAIVILGIIIGAALFIRRSTNVTAAPKAAKRLPAVTVATPVKMPIVEWDEYVGRLAALDSVNIRSRVSGYLATTHYQEGQIVKVGDLLVVIDQRPFRAEVTRAEAAIAAANAQLEQARAAVGESEAELKRTQASRELAVSRQRRAEDLRQQTAIAKEEAEIRTAELAQAEASVAVSLAKIESAKSAVLAAQAAVNVSQASLETAQLNLQYTEIRAPIGGRISNRLVTEGNLVIGGTSDSTLLTTIVSVDPIHCYFDTDEQSYLKYVRLAREGVLASSREARNPVYIALANERDGFPHWGHMDFIENRLDNETATMRGRAIFPNKDGGLTPGLFARVRIPGSPKHEAILVPDRAIATDQAEKFVLVIDDDNRVVRKGVVLGPVSHGLRVIRSGLTGAERVVLTGQQRAKVGGEVTLSVETIVAGKESLPDDFEAVPEEKWLNPKRTTAGNVATPDEPRAAVRKVETQNTKTSGEELQ